MAARRHHIHKVRKAAWKRGEYASYRAAAVRESKAAGQIASTFGA
jgi:hypothetical protein